MRRRSFQSSKAGIASARITLPPPPSNGSSAHAGAGGAPASIMGKFLAVLIVAGLGGLYYHQTHQTTEPGQSDKKPASAEKVTASTTAPASASTVRQSGTPAPPSQHNWMKRSLDRASDAANQSRAQTQRSQDP